MTVARQLADFLSRTIAAELPSRRWITQRC